MSKIKLHAFPQVFQIKLQVRAVVSHPAIQVPALRAVLAVGVDSADRHGERPRALEVVESDMLVARLVVLGDGRAVLDRDGTVKVG